jgi:hypothetical protein
VLSDSDPFLAEIRSTYGRVAYTHKTHEKDAEIRSANARRLRVANVAVFGIAAVAAVIAPLLQSGVAAWVAAVSTVIGFVFSALQLSFDPAAEAAAHRMAAKSYLSIRNELAKLIADCRSTASVTPALRGRRDDLGERMRIADDLAPQTSQRAYAVAQDAIKNGDELTFSEEELNALLPDPPPRD